VKLPCPPLVWNRLNRFQKYLWVVDDTECRWQYLKRRYHFDYLELQLEALDQIHGMLEYEKISNFLGIGTKRHIPSTSNIYYLLKGLKTNHESCSINIIRKRF
jgi:hypothetical protein